MGVEQLIRDRFHAAEDYRKEWNEWQSSKTGIPPRRDLELDALLEILDGDRLVHCHSYRSDEIIMFMRVAEDFGFRIGTFQHVLEGYKCADEIAFHGAGASAFSDWWSYKYEVIDAIPYAGEIMWRRGVKVSFNSDSSELSRRLNLEAAKAVKYGDVPEEEALAFVTRNPATQLGIDAWVGSLEPGKDADFVLWSQHPLSDMALCEQTWIEGVRRFSREDDSRRRPAALELRDKLLAKAKQAWKSDDPRLEKEETETPAFGASSRSAFGRKWGESLERESAHLHQGECELCGHSCGGL
jgi:N-acetylglucosamine-6-phosphate deacetylase